MAHLVEHGLGDQQRGRKRRRREQVDLVQDDVGIDDDPLRYIGWDSRKVCSRSQIMFPRDCIRAGPLVSERAGLRGRALTDLSVPCHAPFCAKKCWLAALELLDAS